jgi:hypothetical protein
MVSIVVLTAAPADVEPWPVLASALVVALRAELLLAVAEAVALAVAVLTAAAVVVVTLLTLPVGAFDSAVPAGVPPEVAT